MSTREAFSDEEWSAIVQAPLLAGFAVTAADPGGLVGAVQEASAMAGAMKSADGASSEDSLIGGVIAALKTSEGRKSAQSGVKDLIKGRKPAEASAAAITQLQTTMTMVASKAPEQAEAFSQVLRSTAQKVAEAAKEGGFMGFGGEVISEPEKQALADLDAALAASR